MLDCALLAALLSASPSAAAQELFHAHSSAPQAQWLGKDLLVGPGDLDGDGVGDVVFPSCEPAGHVSAVSGATGALLWKVPVDGPVLGVLVHALDACGDLDGDGVPDLVLGTGSHGSAVAVLSGKSGAAIWWFSGPGSNEQFGRAVAGAGDLDGNGVPDVLVGAPWMEPGGSPQPNLGAVWALEGVAGELLYVVHGPVIPGQSSGSQYGEVLGAVGDQDQDGVTDFVVGTGSAPHRVDLRSGADGELIASLPLTGGALSAMAIRGLGDLDGDGIDEFAIGFRGTAPGQPLLSGLTRVFRGGSLDVIATLVGTHAYETSGGALVAAGDLDGDGTDDLLIGSLPGGQGWPMPPWGYVRAFSGADFTPLFVLSGPDDGHAEPYFGTALARVGDATQDGRAEFAVVSHTVTDASSEHGVRVLTFSPAALALQGSPSVVSLASDDVHQLAIDFGEAHAGSPYVLLGSFDGTKSDWSVDGLPLPLTPDVYTWFALGGGGLAQPFVGQLDVAGRATVLASGAGLPASVEAILVGHTLWHAALAFAPSGPAAAVSNPSPLTFAP